MLKKNVVMIFRIGSLGDTLVAIPSFHLIRQSYPDSKIILLTNTPVNNSVKAASSFQILNGTCLVDDYLEYPHGSSDIAKLREVANSIRQLEPDLLVYLMPQRSFLQRLRDFVFFQFSGIRKFRGIWVKNSSNTHIFNEKKGFYESEASRLVRSVGFKSEQISKALFSIKPTEYENSKVRQIVQADDSEVNYISLSVGSKLFVKDWGEANWTSFMAELVKIASGYKLLFIGSSDESERCEKLLNAWPNGGVNLCGLLTPRESATALSMTKLFIGHDSGPMHLASSVGIPTIAIFASRSKKGVWFPFANEQNVFYTEIACSNCGLEVCEEKAKQCINAIEPSEVVNRVKEILIIGNM
jgi:ADP-heptose:LPS heptosyltransferase